MNESLTIERVISAPIDRVWRALIDPQDLKQWLSFFSDFKPEVGFKTEFDLGSDAEHQYHHHVEVLEVVEQQKLSYSWDYGGMSNGSSVTFELFAEADGTRLVLTCRFDRVPTEMPDFLKNALAGWNYTASSLKKFAENN